jgi:conjugative transposon TraM protein
MIQALINHLKTINNKPMNQHSEKFLRKRKALLFLPLVALPLITMAFWSLGGGKGSGAAGAQQKQGINTTLPNAQLSGASLDKMGLYDKAATDSQSLKSKAYNDPFADGDTVKVNASDTGRPGQEVTPPVTPGGMGNYTDPNEAKVRLKLAQLEQAINKPQAQTVNNDPTSQNTQALETELNRLQQSMQQAGQNTTNGQDPQMQQMNGMLEKILNIQHPDRVQEQLRQQSIKNRGRVYPVTRPGEQTDGGLLSVAVSDGIPLPFAVDYGGNGFYDTEGDVNGDTAIRPAIPAVVQDTRTVSSGSTIKLRLTEDVMIDGVLIPKNNFISGKCSLDGERLKIEITGIRFKNSLFPVGLSVYDLDAIEGICIPGAVGRDASKEGTDRAIQSMQLMSLDPSLGTQAASAGLEAVKGFASKKVKLVRVTVKAGYPVLLMDQKAKQGDN